MKEGRDRKREERVHKGKIKGMREQESEGKGAKIEQRTMAKRMKIEEEGKQSR